MRMLGISFFYPQKTVLSQPNSSKQMKYPNYHQLLLVCTVLWATLASCGKPQSNDVVIDGYIKGVGNDTLYLYGIDRMYDRIDTLFAQNDRFTAHLKIDTLTTALLLFNHGTEYPLFLDKANKITIKGDIASPAALQVSGNDYNRDMTLFNSDLGSLTRPSEEVLTERADTFITTHPSSLVSAYLINKYFVQQPQPDYAKIKKLTEQLTGTLKDRPYLLNLTKRIDGAETAEKGKSLPFFRLRNAKGEDITRTTTFKDKYLLLHFWASWDTLSRADNAMYRRIYKKEKKNKNFALLGFALDADKKQWLHTLKTDTLQWEQTCDPAGWSAELVKQLFIQQLPTSLLITPNGRIEAYNMDEQAIKEKLIAIDKEAKEKERLEKERKRRERRRNR